MSEVPFVTSQRDDILFYQKLRKCLNVSFAINTLLHNKNKILFLYNEFHFYLFSSALHRSVYPPLHPCESVTVRFVKPFKRVSENGQSASVALPLPVLIHAVDYLVALFDDGDQLRHQLLLPTLVLVCPVFFWRGEKNCSWRWLWRQSSLGLPLVAGCSIDSFFLMQLYKWDEANWQSDKKCWRHDIRRIRDILCLVGEQWMKVFVYVNALGSYCCSCRARLKHHKQNTFK